MECQCSGHGTCKDGVCACEGAWSGPACDSNIFVFHLFFYNVERKKERKLYYLLIGFSSTKQCNDWNK